MAIADDGILRDGKHPAVQEAVAGEIEGVDLDLGILASTNEADVPVRHHCLDLQMAVLRHNDEQCLRRGDDAADGVDRKLLHDTVDGRDEQLKLGSLFRFNQILRQSCGLPLGLDQFA